MSVLLQVSDTHFGTEQPVVAQALVALAHQQRPELVVLSGDITQRAQRAQFRDASAFMSLLGAPLLAVPGNHDLPLFEPWARLRAPYARHVEAFGAELEPLYESPGLRVIGVNTTRPWRHSHGEISAAQIERVAVRLAGAGDGQLRVVVVHQPAAAIRAEDAAHLVRGHAAALPRWATAGADVVMGGHIHLPYVVALPGLARPMWVVQAGTAVSTRLRRGVPNSVNLLRWGAHTGEGRCLVEQWDFSAAAQAFVRAAVTELRPARTS
jgi:3',5'-cyclic AMP phosphodiesterase CpdA